MKIRLGGVVLAVLLGCVVGCQKREKTEADYPFPKVTVGMNVGDAERAIGKPGVAVAEDKLPVAPGPRGLYPKIPEATTWQVWWQEENGTPIRPSLILGVYEERIVFKQVWYKDGDQWPSASWTLPAFQK